MIKNTLDNLKYAQEMEAYWRKSRIREEEKVIVELSDPSKLEGSQAITVEKRKVVITKKLTYKLDYDKYQAMHLLPESQFVHHRPVIDLKKMRKLQDIDPDAVSECVTSKSAKTSVTVKLIEVES